MPFITGALRWTSGRTDDILTTHPQHQMESENMTTAGNNPLYGRFDEMLDNVLHPRTRRAPGVSRCADLYCGDGTANRAAFAAGTDTVYAYTLDTAEAEPYLERFGIEPFVGTTGDSVRMAPDFDLLLVRMDGSALTPPPQSKRGRQRYDAPVEHALRFMRVRHPAGVLFWGCDLPDGFVAEIVQYIADDAERLSYLVGKQSSDGIAFVVAIRTDGPFPWPNVLTLESVIEAMELEALRMAQ